MLDVFVYNVPSSRRAISLKFLIVFMIHEIMAIIMISTTKYINYQRQSNSINFFLKESNKMNRIGFNRSSSFQSLRPQNICMPDV